MIAIAKVNQKENFLNRKKEEEEILLNLGKGSFFIYLFKDINEARQVAVEVYSFLQNEHLQCFRKSGVAYLILRLE